MKTLVPIAVVALLVLCAITITAILGRSRRARENRRERERHETFLDDLYTSALEARDVEPFAGVLADRIRNHLTINRKAVR